MPRAIWKNVVIADVPADASLPAAHEIIDYVAFWRGVQVVS